MSLPSSGSLSLSMIKTEIGANKNTLAQNIAASLHPEYTKQSQFYGYTQAIIPNMSIVNSAPLYSGGAQQWTGFDVSNDTGLNPQGKLMLILTVTASTIGYSGTLNVPVALTGTQTSSLNAALTSPLASVKIFKIYEPPINGQFGNFTQTATIQSGTGFNIGSPNFVTSSLTIATKDVISIHQAFLVSGPDPNNIQSAEIIVNTPSGHVGLVFLVDNGNNTTSTFTVLSSSALNAYSITYARQTSSYNVTISILPYLSSLSGNPYAIGIAEVNTTLTIPRLDSTMYVDTTGFQSTEFKTLVNGSQVADFPDGDAQVVYRSSVVASAAFTFPSTHGNPDIAIHREPYSSAGPVFTNLYQTLTNYVSGTAISVDFSQYNYRFVLTPTAVSAVSLSVGTLVPIAETSSLEQYSYAIIFSPSNVAYATNLVLNVSLSLSGSGSGASSVSINVNGTQVAVLGQTSIGSTSTTLSATVPVGQTCNVIVTSRCTATTGTLTSTASAKISSTTTVSPGTINTISAAPMATSLSIETTGSGSGSPSGPSSPVCLLANQALIIDENFNTKNVEDITTSDYVYTAHETTQELKKYKVSKTEIDSVSYWYSVTTVDNRNIKCSASHLFMINGFKKKAEDLSFEDSLMILENDKFIYDKIKSIEIVDEVVDVYKIEVQDAHTYLTSNMVWQHNYKTPPPGSL